MVAFCRHRASHRQSLLNWGNLSAGACLWVIREAYVGVVQGDLSNRGQAEQSETWKLQSCAYC